MEDIPNDTLRRCVRLGIRSLGRLSPAGVRHAAPRLGCEGGLLVASVVRTFADRCNACGVQTFLDLYAARVPAPIHVGRACAGCGEVIRAVLPLPSDPDEDHALRMRFESGGTFDAFLAWIEQDRPAPDARPFTA